MMEAIINTSKGGFKYVKGELVDLEPPEGDGHFCYLVDTERNREVLSRMKDSFLSHHIRMKWARGERYMIIASRFIFVHDNQHASALLKEDLYEG